MAAIFNTSFVDLLLAPGLSGFTQFEAPDLTAQHPEATHWLANYFLNSLLGTRYKDKYRQWALNQLFRAEIAFRDYHEARTVTLELLEKGCPGQPAVRTYFRAVGRWESCLLNIQIFIDLANRMKKEIGDSPVFIENDGSRDQRAYAMANTIKHWGSDVAVERHEEHHTIPLWLLNEGLTTRSHQLSYAELASLVAEIATVADVLQNPNLFAGEQ